MAKHEPLPSVPALLEVQLFCANCWELITSFTKLMEVPTVLLGCPRPYFVMANFDHAQRLDTFGINDTFVIRSCNWVEGTKFLNIELGQVDIDPAECGEEELALIAAMFTEAGWRIAPAADAPNGWKNVWPEHCQSDAAICEPPDEDEDDEEEDAE